MNSRDALNRPSSNRSSPEEGADVQATPRRGFSLVSLLLVMVASVACWAGLAIAVYVLLRIFLAKG